MGGKLGWAQDKHLCVSVSFYLTDRETKADSYALLCWIPFHTDPTKMQLLFVRRIAGSDTIVGSHLPLFKNVYRRMREKTSRLWKRAAYSQVRYCICISYSECYFTRQFMDSKKELQSRTHRRRQWICAKCLIYSSERFVREVIHGMRKICEGHLRNVEKRFISVD